VSFAIFRTARRTAISGAAALALVLSASVATATQAEAATIPIGAGLFGLHVNDPVGHYPTVPFGTVRLWDSGTSWRDIQPSPGVWDFTQLDAQVAKLRAARKDIVIVLGVTPRWASKRPNEAGNYGPGTAAEPRDIRTWTAYVRKLAIRYKGKVNKWELYNEPNVKLFFSGQPKNMLDMARTAWTQLKTIDPANTVISPGVAIRTDNSPKWLDTYLQIGGGRYANAIAVHFYVRARERPENTIGYLATVRKIMAARGVAKMPLWNTESGYGRATPDDPKTNEIYTGSTAMAYVARTYVLMAAGNVARSYWYGWDQRGFTGLYLTDVDQATANVAGKAYGVTYKWLVGARIGACVKTLTGAAAGNYSCSLVRGAAQIRIIWNPDRSRNIRIPAGYRSLQRLDGSKVSVRAGSVLTIGPLPVLISTAP
jgi:hypothetical protein